MSPKTIEVGAILFDMDGTLIDSTPGVRQAWATFAADYGLNAEEVMHATHGRRLYDTIREWCGVTDEAKLHAEIARFEDEVIAGGPEILPGVHRLLGQIRDDASTNSYGWTIVTSASNIYTPKALERVGIALPEAGVVTSNDVTAGKPHPDPYLAGAEKCRVPATSCLVVEDAPSGLRAGRVAGAKTLAVCTSHTRAQILGSGTAPDFIVEDLTRVSVKWVDGVLQVLIDDSYDGDHSAVSAT